MKRAIVVLLLLAAAAAGCGGGDDDDDPPAERAARTCEPTESQAETVTAAAEDTPSRVRMAPGMELEANQRTLAAARIGEPLVVTGVVSGTDCAPLPGATVYAWQTNGDGRYGPTRGDRDRCCYLQAAVRTDEEGRYTLDTVMPKGYDGGPSHIHFQAGHPDAEGRVTELVFDAPTTRAEYDITLPHR
jgi:protocatechuate 3,4-dioxygenase beta subunit